MFSYLMSVAETGTAEASQRGDVGSGGLLVVIRAAAGERTGVAGVPLCNILASGGTVFFIVPGTSCAGWLVSKDPVLVSLIE